MRAHTPPRSSPMNKFITQLSHVSPNHFGFYSGGEYVVCVADYPRTVPFGGSGAYIDGYYEISNSQYHKTQKFLAFCKENGVGVEIERDKPYKDFLFDNGFFGRGKNSLLYDAEFGSKIYFTVLKVTKLPSVRENRLEFVKFLQILKSKSSRFKTPDESCGACTLCLSACPQKAIPNCLENCLRTHMQEGKIEKSFSQTLENRVLGCEICSEICPKNKKVALQNAESTELSQFLSLVEKKDTGLCEKYGKNIISKNKLTPYILNAMGNSGEIRYKEILEKYEESDNEKFKIASQIALETMQEKITAKEKR